jgi:hypothetical protein
VTERRGEKVLDEIAQPAPVPAQPTHLNQVGDSLISRSLRHAPERRVLWRKLDPFLR